MNPVRIGIGGPVGAGKTALTRELCTRLASKLSMAVVTNDIYTSEDADYLVRSQALPATRIRGVETGGCPHTAIREDVSINLQAIDQLTEAHPDLQLVLIESGGDNLAATFSPELADIMIYVISCCMGEEIPRKGGLGITDSDILIINKIDLAEHVEVDLDVMLRDANKQRQSRPTFLTNLKTGDGIQAIITTLTQLTLPGHATGSAGVTGCAGVSPAV